MAGHHRGVQPDAGHPVQRLVRDPHAGQLPVPGRDARPRRAAGGVHRRGDAPCCPRPAGRDLAQCPPGGRHRGDQAEQLALVADHPEVADRLAAVGDRAGQVRQHPAPVMHQQPVRGQRPGQARGQAGVVGQRPDQRHPGVRHDPGTAASDFQPLQPAGSLHSTGAPRSGPDEGLDTPILPGQEHFS